MSGKFTNLGYDQQAYKQKISRSTNPLLYKLDPNFSSNCSSCFYNVKPEKKIDVDSVMKGINKINSKSNAKQVPDPAKKSFPINDNCIDKLEFENTRYTHPAYDIKGLTVPDMHFEYPLHDPQCQIFENFQVNTRLQAKDNHKAVWQVPFSQEGLLPKNRSGTNKNLSNGNYAAYP
ncbi:MAG: hypothetical protein Satyrvirus9_19 [Satyrvirus sp.]|uniref:Uncharacterized protein n=1 Tax=Satyrvirus sp. TaxID=2487771 RepID=A0A3G5AHE1_9VIRU|nr:MAG: hypothetical protein Satyrvirus9_19 [Satyrvirus sp.]